MISVIICSIKPDLCNKVVDNFKSFIGVECEFIIFDNREKNWGICKVYNDCAARARYSYLCFIHEDILIETENWGKILIDFYETTKNCGIIGFAGSCYAPKNFSSWYDSYPDIYTNYWEYSENEKKYVHFFSNPLNQEFSEVITLDGLFLFLSKNVYENVKFDEETFTRFHFYDADITLHTALKYKNFVNNSIHIYHRSPGYFDDSFCEDVFKFQRKWNSYLPTPISYYSKLNWLKKEIKCAYGIYFLFKSHHISRSKFFKHLFSENNMLTSLLVLLYIPFKFIKRVISR
jgi:hypothetical protein